jgi:hypothetical protein
MCICVFGTCVNFWDEDVDSTVLINFQFFNPFVHHNRFCLGSNFSEQPGLIKITPLQFDALSNKPGLTILNNEASGFKSEAVHY